MDDDGLEADLEEVLRSADLLHAETLRRIAEGERRGSFARDGHLSVVSWLVGRFRLAWSVAHVDVRTARALRSMPRVRSAFGSGDIGRAALGALVEARGAHPAAFAEAEELLVDAARSLGARDLRRALDTWRGAIDHRAAEVADRERHERRNLHVSPTFDGMVRVDGDLDPENGQALLTALRAIGDADVRNGIDRTRSPAQRRADALGEVCRRWLDRSDRPTVAGERPHVIVTIDVDALRGRADGNATLDRDLTISPGSARRLACDASVVRVLTRGPSEPLDVGRRTPVVPPAIRRALIVRDGGCAFPACDRPPSWTDAHHVRHWADGGPTTLSNLTLLCRPHHRSIHAGSFSVAIERGRPVFRRADGSPIDDRAPP